MYSGPCSGLGTSSLLCWCRPAERSVPGMSGAHPLHPSAALPQRAVGLAAVAVAARVLGGSWLRLRLALLALCTLCQRRAADGLLVRKGYKDEADRLTVWRLCNRRNRAECRGRAGDVSLSLVESVSMKCHVASVLGPRYQGLYSQRPKHMIPSSLQHVTVADGHAMGTRVGCSRALAGHAHSNPFSDMLC
jgi:hypothetical protein